AGALTVTDSTINNNTAIGNAGGILNDSMCSMDIANTTIADNTSFAYGGGVSTSGRATVTGGSINDNFAGRGGGGIDNYLGSLEISGVSIRNNTAGKDGGGIYTNGAERSNMDGDDSGETPPDGAGSPPSSDVTNGADSTVTNCNIANNR